MTKEEETIHKLTLDITVIKKSLASAEDQEASTVADCYEAS